MNALFSIMVLLLSAGFAKLCVAVLNWWFAKRHSKRVVVASHLINFFLIVAYPLLLLSQVGAEQVRLLSVGQVAAISIVTWMLIVPGVFGFGVLVWSTIEYQRYAPPRCLTKTESHRVDLRIDLGANWKRELVGPGPMRSVALLPGNEQFTIDISTVSCSFSRLPFEWDGLSIVHLSDLHFRGAVTRRYFEIVCERAAELQPDLVVVTGDLLDDLSLIDWLPKTLGRLTAPLGKYFILGNHDWYLDPQPIRRELGQLGWIDLAGRTVSLDGRGATPVLLCGDETPWMGAHPDASAVPSESFRILLSHTPDNISWAREQRFDLMLAGHTHGGQIRLPFIGPVYSPSHFGCRYSAGDFWLAPTLLHVSRGISGREPIRYNCPPEVTKLVLKRTISDDA